MIDLHTEEAKLKYHQTLLRIWNRLERIMFVRLKPIIGRQFLNVASLYAHGIKDIDFPIEKESKRLLRLFSTHYRRVMLIANREVEKALIEIDKKATLGEFFERSMNAYIKNNTAKQITKINNTTKKQINLAIEKGLEEGESNALIAKRIRRVKGITTNYRSRMISRTETHSAYSFATDQSIKSKGRKFDRVWATTIDERTRRSHVSANKQKREMDIPFDVGGEHLLYPGDPKGSAKNIIHCRCALLYERNKSLARRKQNNRLGKSKKL